jgi:translation initiation factor 2B subunit (eIF-2B alpha/beta/delta family)
MHNDELLEQIGKLITPLQDGQERIEKTQYEQGTVIAQIKTALEALAAGQQDIKDTMATKADVQDIKADLVKQQRRIENLEEHTKTPNPHKN